MKTIGVIGAGSWGTALATVLAGKGWNVRIYDVDEQHLHRMEASRENTDYLPGVALEDNITIAYPSFDDYVTQEMPATEEVVVPSSEPTSSTPISEPTSSDPLAESITSQGE